jgi:hypothetical protein
MPKAKKPCIARRVDPARTLTSAEISRRWRERNPERVKELAKKYYLSHGVKEYRRRWRQANPEATLDAARRYRERHPDRTKEAQRKYRERHPERVKEQTRLNYEKHGEKRRTDAKRLYHEDAAYRERQLDRHRQRKYGLSRADFEALVSQQSGCCAACHSPFTQTPHVDHDHGTGAIRALLCYGCNIAVGVCNENPEQLRAAADYIEGCLVLRKGAA